FLADGLTLKKTGLQGKTTLLLTFVPPLAVVLINPGIYIQAFNYAGICCVLLLLLLPSAMAWQARRTDSDTRLHLVPGGQLVLGIMGLIAVCLLVLACIT